MVSVLRGLCARTPLPAKPLPRTLVVPQQRRQYVCQASRKKGRKDRPHIGSGGSGDAHRLQDAIRDQRQQQLAATDMLAKLLQAQDPRQVADQYTSSLDEQFFWAANIYLSMAKREGNAEVVSQLERALKAAFDAKQATLRPEIQLLNLCLASETDEELHEVLSAPEAASRLTMNDRYFFHLLDRIVQDVRGQPESEQRAALLAKLDGIQADATKAAAAP